MQFNLLQRVRFNLLQRVQLNMMMMMMMADSSSPKITGESVDSLPACAK